VPKLKFISRKRLKYCEEKLVMFLDDSSGRAQHNTGLTSGARGCGSAVYLLSGPQCRTLTEWQQWGSGLLAHLPPVRQQQAVLSSAVCQPAKLALLTYFILLRVL